jgi:hypothetical protein
MTNDNSFVKWVIELLALDEARFLVDFHQTDEKARQKSWHDRHIKTKMFAQGDQVMLYDSKYQKNPRKPWMHWLGPFVVAEIRESEVVILPQIYGILRPEWVNGAHLNPYIFS